MALFLTFDNHQNALDAADALDTLYGLPDGLGTDQWAIPAQAWNLNIWYFPGPEEGYKGKTIAEGLAAIDAVVPGSYEQRSSIPQEWYPPNEE